MQVVETTFRTLRADIDAHLHTVMQAKADELLRVSSDLLPMVDTLQDFLEGGKRLRPTFAYWGWRAAGGDPSSPAIIRAAAGLEFLQACALLHDDVMDASDTRRGKPAAHRRIAAMHRSNSYLGSPESFGEGSAILLGDLCLSWSDELLMSSGIEQPGLGRAKQIFDTMRTELMAGQYLDLLEQVKGGFSVDRSLTVARYKSAKYTVERPLQLGAAAAGADDRVLDGLSDFGIPLGEAFQLRDDVLGVFGDPATTGKPAGDDLREGKRTALVAIAWDNADPMQQDLLRRHLGDPAIGREMIERLRQVITQIGARQVVDEMISDRAHRCRDQLHDLPLDDQTRSALDHLVTLATDRSA